MPESEFASESKHGASNPPRVVVYGTESAQEICLHNPLGVADRIGLSVLAAFLKCFMGVERVLTFEHLMYLNMMGSKSEAPRLTDEHSFDRNRKILAMLLAGAMYEVGEALQDLCNARVAIDPAIRPAWAQLDLLRAQWNDNEFASKIRNTFAHHLGKREDYAEGLKKLVTSTGEDPLVIYETDGGKRQTGHYPLPWLALEYAHDIHKQMKNFDEFVKRTQEAHNALPELVLGFFREVLDARGVPVIVQSQPREK